MELNQYYSTRWSFLEIVWFLLTSTLTGRPVLSEIWDTLRKTETIRSHKSRARIPSNLNPASKGMISDSVELCETEVLFLAHSNLSEQMYDFQKMHNVPPEVDFESSRSPANRSLETVPACIVLQYYPHSNNVCTHMCDECKISIDSSVCHMLWSIL